MMTFDALRITQPSGREVYAFAATAESILRIAEIPRISRDSSNRLNGYQRPEMVNHITEIRRYIDSQDAVIPNTIVIAFDENVQFTPYHTTVRNSISEYGSLEVPENKDEADLPGFVVDGQQRLAAIASCRYGGFPVFVTAIIAPRIEEQRKQFVLVNRTKPLTQGLVFELLPEIDGVLPQYISKQRFAASIVANLNLTNASSLKGRIKTPTCPKGYIKDNSMRRLILNSLSDGASFNLAQEGHDEVALRDRIVEIISIFWEGVSKVFPLAFNLPPNRSRLTHGVGVLAMGYVMDQLYFRYDRWDTELIVAALEPLRDFCSWTEGFWDFDNLGRRRWNELQNTDRDIRLLVNHFRLLLEKHECRITP